MRSILNSGNYWLPWCFSGLCFCPVGLIHLSVCIVFSQTLYIISFSCISHKLSVYVKSSVGLHLSVCLSPLSFPPSPPPSLPTSLGLHPRIFSHPNVLPVLGACLSPAPHPVIITHWMPYGSLYNVLHEGTSEYFYSGHKVCIYLFIFLTTSVVLKEFVNNCTCTYVILLLQSHYGTPQSPCHTVIQPLYHYVHLILFLSCRAVRLCCGPDASSKVCSGHCLWNGLLTHAWTNDPTPLSQQQKCYGKYEIDYRFQNIFLHPKDTWSDRRALACLKTQNSRIR